MSTEPHQRVGHLMNLAAQAHANGRVEEVDRIIRQVEREAPDHPVSLNEAAQRKIKAGDLVEARSLLEAATVGDPSWPVAWVNLAAVLRGLGAFEEEQAALDRALMLNPRDLRALLQSGAVYEAQGETRTAAAVYRRAVESAPQDATLPRETQAHLLHARRVIEANTAALDSFLEASLSEVRARHFGGGQRRFDKSLAVVLQKQKIYRQKPSFLYFPELPCIEFYDRKLFPWLDQLEAAADDIRAECSSVLSQDDGMIEPYVHGLTQNDTWARLNDSLHWGVYYLWRTGAPCPQNLARCPKTAAALEAWPRCELQGSSPSAVFSILNAKTAIPAHAGVNNARLTVHLPLTVPQECWFRVGSETREWEPGKAFVFDDTIEHEAWNGSDVPRTVLILDIWNPYLSIVERELVTAMTAAIGDYYGTLPRYI